MTARSSTLPALTDDADARVAAAVDYCTTHSSYYARRLADVGAEAGDIRTVADLERLPVLLSKSDEVELQAHSETELGHPFGDHLCAPIDEVVAVNSTSGTTGDPIFYAFTSQDVAVTDALWARAFALGGIVPGETVVHAFGLSMFLAGVPIVRALERMGARPIPVGAEAGSERLLRIIRATRPAAICCTPSYGEYLIEKGGVQELGIRQVFCAGEPGAGLPEVRARLSEGFGGAGVTDMLGGAHGIMNASCSAYAGMHVLGGETSIQQLIEPETGEPVEIRDGAIGVRVKTSLGWRAQPQLRSSVGDVYEVFTSRCTCGLESPRVKVIGRSDDLLIVKGVKLYPAAIQDLVHQLRPRLTGVFEVVLSAPPPKVEPPLRIRVELGDGVAMPYPAGGTPPVVEELRRAMHDRFAVTPEIDAVRAGTLPRTTHKAKLVRVER